MRRLPLILIVAALVAPLFVAAPAEAAVQQQCASGIAVQGDMAGYYASSTMRVSIYPCGGTYVEWDNAYGTHGASYAIRQHLPDGIIAVGLSGDGWLDNSSAIGFKAAEPGFIQVMTVSDYDGMLRSYRLRKMY